MNGTYKLEFYITLGWKALAELTGLLGTFKSYEKWLVVNTDPWTVFTTLYFLRNLRMVPLRYNVWPCFQFQCNGLFSPFISFKENELLRIRPQIRERNVLVPEWWKIRRNLGIRRKERSRKTLLLQRPSIWGKLGDEQKGRFWKSLFQKRKFEAERNLGKWRDENLRRFLLSNF